MNYKIFIFDFDGTIADSMGQVLVIANRLADEFHFRKIEPSEVENLREMTFREIIRSLEIPIILLPIIIPKGLRELNREMASVKPVKGLKEVLIRLKSLDHQMGILTTNSLENVQKFLKEHEFTFFDFINASSKIWGKDRRLRNLLRDRGWQPNEALYIGDEIRDIEAAQSANVKIAAVTWGYNSQEALKSHGPDYLITRPEQLLHI